MFNVFDDTDEPLMLNSNAMEFTFETIYPDTSIDHWYNINNIYSNFVAHIRDPNNVPHTIRHLKISMLDMTTQPPQQAVARKMMSDAVANAQPQLVDGGRGNVISIGNYDLQLSGIVVLMMNSHITLYPCWSSPLVHHYRSRIFSQNYEIGKPFLQSGNSHVNAETSVSFIIHYYIGSLWWIIYLSL